MMNKKIILITGDIGSGKTTALCHFGLMGDKILSWDHYYAYNKGLSTKSPVIMIMKEFKKLIIEFRESTDTDGYLFVEIPLYFLGLFDDNKYFDLIIHIKSKSQVLAKRIKDRLSEFVPKYNFYSNTVFSKHEVIILENNGFSLKKYKLNLKKIYDKIHQNVK